MGTDSSLSPQDEDLASLARLAATGSIEDVRLFLTRLVRQYAEVNPELARRLDGALLELRHRHGMGIMRVEPTPLSKGFDILAKAIEVFGGLNEARRWMAQAAPGLDGLLPIDLMETPHGAALVGDYLTRLKHGVYS